jgi:hypothetical protein
MKKIKNTLMKLGILSLFLFTQACNVDLVEMNENPNAITEIEDKFLFTNAVKTTLEPLSDQFGLRMGGQYAHVYVSALFGQARR